MDMTGERRIEAPRQTVWQALNDPAVLKASIPGCESLEKLSDTEMKATAAVKIGPIAARFTGKVHLTDIDPPNGYAIGGEGQGGVAGFAKGGAKVRLEDDGGGTMLRYEVHAQVGGKIAQLGATADRCHREADGGLILRPVQRPGRRRRRRALPTEPSHSRATRRSSRRRRHPPPPSAISPLALIPREPFGMPLVAWIGGVDLSVHAAS